MPRSVALMAAVAALCLPAVPPAASSHQFAEKSKEFCEPRVAKNYLRPLGKLAPVKRIPKSGKLGFAPKGLTLEVIGGQLVVGGGEIGFGFSDEAVDQMRRLNWIVSAELSRVRSGGEVAADIRTKRIRIGSIKGNLIPSLLFKVSGQPTIYRVDIHIARSDNGQILGEYSNYVRVVKSHFDTRLLISSQVAHGAGTISARLANFGTETVSSISPNWRFSVERFNGQTWLEAPSSPPAKKEKPLIQKLTAGQMEPCIDFTVPTVEDPGLYRFSMVVERSAQKGSARRAQLTAEFEIRARSLK